MPPVSSTVPRGVQPAASAGLASARTRRRRNTPEGRSATWSSRPSASTAANRAAVWPSSSVGRSIRPPQNSGCSSPTARPRPHTCACDGLVVTSPAPVCTAPRVSTHNGACTPAWPSTRTRSTVAAVPPGTHGYSASGVSSSASSDTMPLTPATTETSSCSGAAAVTTSAPYPVSASKTASLSAVSSPTTSQVPDSEGAPSPLARSHVIP